MTVEWGLGAWKDMLRSLDALLLFGYRDVGWYVGRCCSCGILGARLEVVIDDIDIYMVLALSDMGERVFVFSENWHCQYSSLSPIRTKQLCWQASNDTVFESKANEERQYGTPYCPCLRLGEACGRAFTFPGGEHQRGYLSSLLEHPKIPNLRVT